MNYNTDTDVNESQFDDLRELYEITEESQIHEFLDDPIILDRYVDNFDYLYDRVVDVAVLCWNNPGEHSDKLQHTLVKFKVTVDDVETKALPLNRFMTSLVTV